MSGERNQGRGWLTPGVRGIGLASLLADLGHEIPTALLPTFLTSVLGAPAAALGIIEGMADGLAGAAKFLGGALADDPLRRRRVALGGYTLTAVLSGLIGLAGTAWQVALLRAGAWTARGIRVPARNALLADAVDPSAFGRAYGFERAMDNLGAVGGPILALGLLGVIGLRETMLVAVVPGLLAALAIAYAIRHLERPKARTSAPVRIVVRPVLRGGLGRLMVGVSAFELGNVAATLMILRATELLTPGRDALVATELAIALYTAYNVAATLVSVPAGRVADRFGAVVVLGAGVGLFAVAYAMFALAGPDLPVLAVAFLAAGVAIGCVETAEHTAVASLAPATLRGSAFGLLAAIQSLGNFAASAVAGILWTIWGPAVAFGYAVAWMAVAVVSFATVGHRASIR